MEKQSGADIKGLLNHHMTLIWLCLAYRAIPLKLGDSLAELLMGLYNRAKLIVAIKPRALNSKEVRKKDGELKEAQRKNHHRGHRTSRSSHSRAKRLSVGDTPEENQGEVQNMAGPKSYVVVHPLV